MAYHKWEETSVIYDDTHTNKSFNVFKCKKCSLYKMVDDNLKPSSWEFGNSFYVKELKYAIDGDKISRFAGECNDK